MGNTKFLRLFIALALASLACARFSIVPATETPTAVPTATATIKPTATTQPTSTPKPTATPNAAATQKYDEFNALLEDFMSKGYISSTKGEAVELDNFKEEWARLRTYNFFPPSQEVNTDFVFKSHIKWSTAQTTQELSGCGIAFGLQESNGDHYLVVIDKARIFFGMNRGNTTYQVGKTRGSGRLSFDNPAEADVIISVKDKSSFVSVDGDVTEYTLSEDQTTHGILAFSLLSGSYQDYGTRCEMTGNMLWTASK